MVSEHRDSSTAKIVIFSIYERRILKHADPSIPETVEDWLDEFNTFSIYQVLPELIDLWGMNVQTQAENKNTFHRPGNDNPTVPAQMPSDRSEPS